jgi:superfamily II DNA or RNA helicase
MSIAIPIISLIEEIKQKIANELEIPIKSEFASTRIAILYQISFDNTLLFLPFSYGCNIMENKRPERDTLIPLNKNVKFIGKLREEQNYVKKEALTRLNIKSCVLISSYCGFGKSITAIKLAMCLKLRTIIVCNRIQLIKQWKDSIERFCSNEIIISILGKKNQIEADFYIVNISMLSKLQIPKGIGLVIVDEAHLIVAETLARNLRCINPRYMIGLTATPYRPDGFDILLTHYFGSDPIIRVFYQSHIVYKVKTNFVPVMEQTRQGKLNWSVVINSLSDNEERNKFIANLIFNDIIPLNRNILILVKRVKQGEAIMNALYNLGIMDVTTLMGNSNEFNRDAKILIGTVQKCGCGFDHSKMDTLVLASDVDEYFVQILGRIFRRKDTIPLIYDIVDNQHILEKHFNSRCEVYKKSGGEIRMFEKMFLK